MSIPERDGGEILVNTTTAGNQQAPAITGLANGRFVAAWEDRSDGEIRAQVFNADGSKLGGEFRVNTTTPDSQSNPALTALSDGRFVVTWEDFSRTGGDTSAWTLRGQIFNPDGTRSGSEFLIPTTVAGDQGDATITALADGRFVVVWTDESQTGGDTDARAIRAQIFNGDGTREGNEFLVNTTIESNQEEPTVTALANGNFVVAWTDHSASGGDTDGPSVRAQVFTADGIRLGLELLLNTTTGGPQDMPSITALADGRFVVAWSHYNQSNDSYAIHGQVFQHDGDRSGAEFVVNTTTDGWRAFPRIMALPDGRFVACWEDDSTGNDAVRAQVFNVDGTKAGAEFPVSLPPALGADEPTITALADGRFVIAWSGVYTAGRDASGDSVHAQIFDPRLAAITVTGTAGSDDYIGTIYNDVLLGAAGNDRLTGRGGNDLLEGGDGNDILNGGLGNDTLDGGTGFDVASYAAVTTPVTVSLANPAANTGEAAGDSFTSIEGVLGGAYSDTLSGNSQDNTLDGGAGSDLLKGGSGGFDTLNGGSETDTVDFSAFAAAVWISLGYNGAEAWTMDRPNLTGGTWRAIAEINNVENLVGTAFDDLLRGNGGDNVVRYTGGLDTVDGMGGTDTIDFFHFGAAIWVDLAYNGREAWTRDGIDLSSGAWYEIADLTSVETVVGTAYADDLRGDANANRLIGGNGDDVLNGRGGNDVLDGNGGIDTAVFANRAAFYTISFQGDQFVVSGEGTVIVVDSFETFRFADVTFSRAELLAEIAPPPFTDLGDVGWLSLFGGTFNALGGNDTLGYSGGFVTIDGGAGSDTLTFSEFGSAVWVNLSANGAEGWTMDRPNLTGGTWRPIAEINNVENLTGTVFDDFLQGNGSNNTFIYNGGLDTVNGMGGTDTIDFSHFGSAVWVDLAYNGREAWTRNNPTVTTGTWREIADLAGMEDVVGTAFADDLRGDANVNRLGGGGGNDRLDGRAGNDVLDGGGGVDTLTGGAGNDLFYFTEPGAGEMNGDTITDFQSVTGQNTGDSLVIVAGYSSIAFNNGSTAVTYGGATETLYHPGVTLSLANDILLLM